MNKWLNYHHLLYFKVIATEGSISRASENLLVGQSALSSQLKQLEASLGQKLFHRKSKKLYLTEAGRVALEYANDIFKKGEEFLQVFNEQSLSARPIYKIGVVASAPKVAAYSLMKEAQKDSSSNVISMREEPPETLIQQVLSHQLDIALTNNLRIVENEDLQIKQVGSASISVYGSRKYAKLALNFPQSLKGVEFILPTMHSKLRYDLEHTFREMGIQYKLVAEVQDSSVKKTLAIQGVGLVCLPDFAARPFLKEKKLFKIGRLKNVKEEYWLVSRRRTISSPVTETLLKNYSI